MDAEMIRDQILASSGIVDTMFDKVSSHLSQMVLEISYHDRGAF